MIGQRIRRVLETHSQKIERHAEPDHGRRRSKLEANVMSRRMFAWVTATACILAAVGCGESRAVDLGKSAKPGLLGASLTDYQGDWDGYAEAYKWTDGTDLVRLHLDGNGHGALQVGKPGAPAPQPWREHDQGLDWKPI